MNKLGDYPPGAENDPKAPWNEPEKELLECSEDENLAEFIHHTSVWTGNEYELKDILYCHDCVYQMWLNARYDIEPSERPSFEDFLMEENIERI